MVSLINEGRLDHNVGRTCRNCGLMIQRGDKAHRLRINGEVVVEHVAECTSSLSELITMVPEDYQRAVSEVFGVSINLLRNIVNCGCHACRTILREDGVPPQVIEGLFDPPTFEVGARVMLRPGHDHTYEGRVYTMEVEQDQPGTIREGPFNAGAGRYWLVEWDHEYERTGGRVTSNIDQSCMALIVEVPMYNPDDPIPLRPPTRLVF